MQVQNSSCVTSSLPETLPLLTRELSNYVFNTIFPVISRFCRLLTVSPYFCESLWMCHFGRRLNLYRSLDIYSNPQGLLPCQRRKWYWFDMICSLKSILTISYHIVTLQVFAYGMFIIYSDIVIETEFRVVILELFTLCLSKVVMIGQVAVEVVPILNIEVCCLPKEVTSFLLSFGLKVFGV